MISTKTFLEPSELDLGEHLNMTASISEWYQVTAYFPVINKHINIKHTHIKNNINKVQIDQSIKNHE